MLNKKKLTQAQFIAYAGVLSALAIVLVIIEIPYPLVPWLKIDLSEVIVLIAAVINIWLAIIVATVKAWLTFLVKPDANFIGHLAMWLGSFSILIPYYFAAKKLPKVTSLVIATLAFSVFMTFLNYVYVTPAYMGTTVSEMAGMSQQLTFGTQKMLDAGKAWLDVEVSYLTYIVAMYLPFNLMKGAIVSVAFYFVSNRLNKEK
ncbi:ECF transporter S component [Mollicutes bacterium LVI A0078]|nr:ECF transporter S component [Mollicutes bacterium LVI A0075]WOO91631.1 ECF transporter S component [Mollicutes bacterium LVI A0078]